MLLIFKNLITDNRCICEWMHYSHLPSEPVHCFLRPLGNDVLCLPLYTNCSMKFSSYHLLHNHSQRLSLVLLPLVPGAFLNRGYNPPAK